LDFTSLLRRKSKAVPGSESGAKGPDLSRSLRRLLSICRDLLSESDGISNAARATDAIRLYETLDRPGRIAFFDILIRDFSPNPDDLVRAVDEYRQDPSPANLRRLQQMVEPPRQELFRRLNMAVGGTRALVEMRHLALSELRSNSQLELISSDLGHLLGSWFNSGFLTMERIDWNSPAVVLERLIAYEAVHQIQGWHDLRRRLEADRRCYGFFHAALPNDPLIFVEVGLTRGMSERIQPLIDPDAPVGDPLAADSAIFYVRAAVLNGCRSALRRRAVRRRVLAGQPDQRPAASAEALVIKGQERDEVIRALGRLPHRQREALVLRFYLELSDEQIARVMDIRQSTVRSTVVRALDALGRDLKETL